MGEAKCPDVKICDALDVIRRTLRSWPAYGHLNASGDNDPWPIEFPTSATKRTRSSQHERKAGVQVHGDSGELFLSSGGLQQGVVSPAI